MESDNGDYNSRLRIKSGVTHFSWNESKKLDMVVSKSLVVLSLTKLTIPAIKAAVLELMQ